MKGCISGLAIGLLLWGAGSAQAGPPASRAARTSATAPRTTSSAPRSVVAAPRSAASHYTAARSAPRVAMSDPAPVEDLPPAAMSSEYEIGGGEFDGASCDCGDGESCDTCDTCWEGCDPPRDMWGRAEYLLWWIEGMDTPPLVTTSPVGTPAEQAGVLPNAQILFGDEPIANGAQSGGRFTLGAWLDECECWAIEGTAMVLERAGTRFSASTDDFPILARPFTDVTDGLPGVQASTLVGFPDQVTGSIEGRTSTSALGAEANVRKSLWNDPCRRFDILVGYRFFRLNDGLRIDENTLDADEAQIRTVDVFNTENRFHGGQIGAMYEIKRGCWSLEILGKLAYGGMSQEAEIYGSTTLNPGQDQSDRQDGGVLALSSNSGLRRKTDFSLIPELNLNLRRQVGCHGALFVGYTFMLVTDVARAGDQIDPRIDTDLFPPPVGDGGSFPAFTFHTSDVWLQGLNFGFETRF